MNLIKPMQIVYKIIDDKKHSKKIIIAYFENTGVHPNYFKTINSNFSAQIANFIYWKVEKLKGKAVCCLESDKFDLEYGFKLARKRLLAKYYKQLHQALVESIPRLQNSLDAAKKVLIYSEDRKKLYSNQVNYLTGMKK